MGSGRRNSVNDPRKKSLYLPREMLDEVEAEAKRQDRSVSWVIQQAWLHARPSLARYPSVAQFAPPPKYVSGYVSGYVSRCCGARITKNDTQDTYERRCSNCGAKLESGRAVEAVESEHEG